MSGRVYLVEFSDWDAQRVVAVYDNEDAAKEHAARSPDTLGVEEFDIQTEVDAPLSLEGK